LDQSLLPNFYQLGFLRDDPKEMKRCLSAALGKPDEDELLSSHADTEAFHGRIRQARELSRQAVESATRADNKERAASWQVNAALREAEFGNKSAAKQLAVSARTLASNREVEIAAALALARAGEAARARVMADTLQKSFPSDTLMAGYWLPCIRASIALSRSDPSSAKEYLTRTATYELAATPPPFSSGGALYPAYLRGQVYLASHRWDDAASEFQKILAHRGLIWNFPLAALAHLQLARAYAGSGNANMAAVSYEAFLDIWRDADPDVPMLQAAKAEYAKIK
jgi:eukaryotic-like serine/threonine-protein kinase